MCHLYAHWYVIKNKPLPRRETAHILWSCICDNHQCHYHYLRGIYKEKEKLVNHTTCSCIHFATSNKYYSFEQIFFVRKFAYLLIYIALSGFVITTIANLLHRRDIAILSVSSSCIALLTGGILLLLSRKTTSGEISRTNNKPSASIGAIGYSAIIIFIIGLVFKILHYSGGELLILLAYISGLLFLIIKIVRIISKKI